jgi:hypothetical protein
MLLNVNESMALSFETQGLGRSGSSFRNTERLAPSSRDDVPALSSTAQDKKRKTSGKGSATRQKDPPRRGGSLDDPDSGEESVDDSKAKIPTGRRKGTNNAYRALIKRAEDIEQKKGKCKESQALRNQAEELRLKNVAAAEAAAAKKRKLEGEEEAHPNGADKKKRAKKSTPSRARTTRRALDPNETFHVHDGSDEGDDDDEDDYEEDDKERTNDDEEERETED